jgi:hypothetical protein
MTGLGKESTIPYERKSAPKQDGISIQRPVVWTAKALKLPRFLVNAALTAANQ